MALFKVSACLSVLEVLKLTPSLKINPKIIFSTCRPTDPPSLQRQLLLQALFERVHDEELRTNQ